MSFAVTSMELFWLSSLTDVVSSLAIGASGSGLTVTVTLAPAVPPLPSEIV